MSFFGLAGELWGANEVIIPTRSISTRICPVTVPHEISARIPHIRHLAPYFLCVSIDDRNHRSGPRYHHQYRIVRMASPRRTSATHPGFQRRNHLFWPKTTGLGASPETEPQPEFRRVRFARRYFLCLELLQLFRKLFRKPPPPPSAPQIAAGAPTIGYLAYDRKETCAHNVWRHGIADQTAAATPLHHPSGSSQPRFCTKRKTLYPIEAFES